MQEPFFRVFYRIRTFIAIKTMSDKHIYISTIFDKDLYKRKSLIIVNSPSSAGTMTVARWNMEDADNIGIVFVDL